MILEEARAPRAWGRRAWDSGRCVSQNRIPELDGYRGLAVSAVLLYHLFWYSMAAAHVPGRNWSGLAALAFTGTKYLWQGVDLFFVLSGFLITGILLDTRSGPRYFGNFYARRALRILPLYYLVLAAIAVFYPHAGGYVILGFLYLCNMAPVFGAPMINGALWSLSVEEHFYLIWPFLVRKLQLRGVAIAAIAVCALEPLIRALAFGHLVSGNIYVYSWFRLDGLASGALIACLIRWRGYSRTHANRLSALLFASGLLLRIAGTPYGILTHDNRLGAMLEFVPANLIFAAGVLYAVEYSGSRRTQFLRSRLLRVAADLSYCLYLIHCMIMNAWDASAKKFGFAAAPYDFTAIVLRAAVVVAICFALAFLARKFIEIPVLRFKRYFQPQPVAEPQAAEAAAQSVS